MLRCAVLLCWLASLPALLFHPKWASNSCPSSLFLAILAKPDPVPAGLNLCLAQTSISWVLNWTQPNNKAPLRQAWVYHQP